MTKFNMLIVLLVVILCFTACTTGYDDLTNPISPISNPLSTDDRQSIVGIQSIIEESNSQTVAVHYPSTGYPKIDVTLSDFANNRIELFNQETASLSLNKDESQPYELNIDYKIVFLSDSHLSLYFTENKFLGSSQPTKTIYTFNYNLLQERQLALKDLFKGTSAYLEIISQYVYDRLINDKMLNVSLDEEWVIKGSTPLESNFKQFLLSENGITIIFEKYQIGPAFIGEPSLNIPYDVFTAYIELKELELTPIPIETTESEEATTVDDPVPVETQPTTEDTAVENVFPKKIALTFEDGPNPIYTPLILDTLKSRGVKATFFVLGNRVEDYSELVKRIYSEGHTIGNHSWSHPQLTRLSSDEVAKQLVQTQDAITTHTGFTPFLYRPPYGFYNETVITSGKMPAILWSIDPMDLKFQDASYIANYVLDHAFDGAIILLRDTNPNTTQALGAIIDGLTDGGFSLVTVDELLGLNAENTYTNIRIFSRGFDK